MKLLFKQRLFSWFDSYDIYDEMGNVAYVVKGQLSWGHKLVIYDVAGNEVGMVVQKVLTFLPQFEIYENGNYVGCISKELFHMTDTYVIDIADPQNALHALMFVLAIDAEKCSRD